MPIEPQEVLIPTLDGRMPACLFTHADREQKPAVLLLMEAFGLTPHIRAVATRIAEAGYVVLTPDLYYREPNSTFGYDEVEQAMARMYRLDFGKPIEADLQATLAYLKSRSDVLTDRIGVTGFCLGGGLTFLTACKFSAEITAAAPFYGMVLDEWIDAIDEITVPVYLFFAGADPFIPPDRIQQIASRFRQLKKDYALKIYADANHGFFCDERASYNRSAAEHSWHELMAFFHQHLQSPSTSIVTS